MCGPTRPPRPQPLAAAGSLKVTVSSALKTTLPDTCHCPHVTDEEALSWACKKHAKDYGVTAAEVGSEPKIIWFPKQKDHF